MLPFLEDSSKWPTSRDPKEKVVSDDSHESSIEDYICEEIIKAIENHDAKSLAEALKAFILITEMDGEMNG